mmetsp:Transcript_22117/g.61396  ORF Transcript_22117/g.61396 Transcript_22117/m.61396 type:complete len:406 (+) Transcript_22117:80-1297(+)
MPIGDPRRPPGPPHPEQAGPQADLDELVAQALQNAGNKGTQSYEKFMDSFPSLNNPMHRERGEEDELPAQQPHKLLQKPLVGLPGGLVQGDSLEDVLRREYEEAADSKEEDDLDPSEDHLQHVEDLDEDGVVVEKLSRTSSGGFFLDGPGNLQFNNFTLDSDAEEGVEEGAAEEPERSTYVPSAVQQQEAAATGMGPAAAAQPPPIKPKKLSAPTTSQGGEVLDGDCIHRRLHGASASAAGGNGAPRSSSPSATSSSTICGQDATPLGLASARGGEGGEKKCSPVLSASFPEAVPGMAGADDKWVEPPDILTDADNFIQSLPMESRSAQPVLNPALGPADPAELQEAAGPANLWAGELASWVQANGTASEDEVMPFKLDSSFDYDNCKLTPKPWPWDPQGRRPQE